jgi:serine/arginine repetitive matrix protein 2
MQNASTAGIRTRKSIVSWVSDNDLSWAFLKDGVKLLAGPMQIDQGPLPLLRRSRSASTMVEEDSSLLKSIYGHAVPASEDVPPLPVVPRQRVESDTSSKRVTREAAMVSSHRQTGSEVSFTGFESFAEIRTKFEFLNETSDYSPDIDTSRKKHVRQESVFSIASVSSYGQVVSGGLRDPFGYGYHSRPPSEDLTGSVNDTFSFLKQDPHRKRFSADSEMSGFYFRPGQGQRRGHNKLNDSVASIYSINGRPVSMYNHSNGQSFGHSRTNSWASGSALAHAYESQGASSGRAAWASHRREDSVHSIDYSAKRLGRPGVGDKLLSSHDHSVPLTAITASPAESALSVNYSSGLPSQDSILDQNHTSADSLFENTRNRSSASSDSIFGCNHYHRLHSNQAQFRPISMLSSEVVNRVRRTTRF